MDHFSALDPLLLQEVQKRREQKPIWYALDKDEEIIEEILQERKEAEKIKTKPAVTSSSPDLTKTVKIIPVASIARSLDLSLSALEREFDRQVATITRKEYIEAAGMKPDEYIKIFEPLKERIREIAQRDKEMKEGHIPFIIVIKNDIGADIAMPLIELEGKKGYTSISADEIKNFKPIEGVKIPNGKAYLAVDIETGKTTLGKTPDEATKKIKLENRSPLTLEEGVALITHHTEILKDNYVWMPGSRRGDNDVANVWLGGGEPGLGCNRATYSFMEWGSASCGERIGF